jgi:DNA-binding NarL/FixJ family response regulator
MKQIRVLLADDHTIILEALKKLIEPAFQIVGVASDGRSLIAQAEKLRPDVVVADINMPLLNGLEACERLRQRVPETGTILLTVNEDVETAREAIRRGALGYLLKKDATTDLFKAIQTVAAGKPYLSRLMVQEPINIFINDAKSHSQQDALTSRQREVLQLLAEGKSMKEAADVLNISARTIAFHKYTMMDHLGIKRNSELVRYAAEAGLCAAAA